MARVNHFEIYTENPEAVRPFYESVFGWKFSKFEGGPLEYWLITTGEDKEPVINGGMTRPREGQSAGTINTVAVESLEHTMKKIEQRGGKICVPKMAIPKIGVAGLRRRSRWQCVWNYRARCGSKIIKRRKTWLRKITWQKRSSSSELSTRRSRGFGRRLPTRVKCESGILT